MLIEYFLLHQIFLENQYLTSVFEFKNMCVKLKNESERWGPFIILIHTNNYA